MEETERSNEDTTQLVTRQQILDQLHQMGHHVSERQLKWWVTYGILPHPTRRMPQGATDGKARAMYPNWMVLVLDMLLLEFARGASRDELKRMAPGLIADYENRPSVSILSGSGTLQPFGVTGLPPVRISRSLQRAVWEYAARYAEQRGRHVRDATITFHTDDGTEVTVPLDPPSSDDSSE